MGRRQGGPSRTGGGGSISEPIRDRGATQPPAHFHRNPLGRGQLAVFPRLLAPTRMTQIWALRSRLEKQPTDLRQNTSYFGDRSGGANSKLASLRGEPKDAPSCSRVGIIVPGPERSAFFLSFPFAPESRQLLHQQLPVPTINLARQCQQHG